MHNNYFFLRKLAPELEAILQGSVVSECFSQSKDELIIRFETTQEPFFIKASLLPEFCCLSFPKTFNRARKNSVDLFRDIIGMQLQRVKTYANERCFSITLTDGYELLFKLHGNRANVVLFRNQVAHELFRNHLQADLQLNTMELAKEIDWSEAAFQHNLNNLKEHYFTFGKVLWQYLDARDFKSQAPAKQWNQINELLRQLEHPEFMITEVQGRLILSLVPIGTVQEKFASAVKALNEFFVRHTVHHAFHEEKQRAVSALATKLKNAESYLEKTRKKLSEIEADDHYKRWADLIMANLQQVKPGMEKIVLPDFYQDQKPVEIKLKPAQSAQRNAEIFYRKSKNHHIEITKLREAIERKETEAKHLKDSLAKLADAPDLKTLRQLTVDLELSPLVAKKEISIPYHEIEFKGFMIWIGKNAKSNDVLTLKHTYKEDLWLHAKDVAGSHVVIKHQAGKKFPKEVIERAAQLAAYHSKRKTDSLCPVAVTPKKYVRKRKGDPPGAVMVEKEEVILVEPTA
jgi:predicted ribosome quality control (RQC) complex YloA/Tae2 family protein